MKVLFLYTELADYILKCCIKLAETAEVHIVRWPLNKEAPFVFNFPDNISVYDKNTYSFGELASLVKGLNPDLIVCSGWVDKEYLKITKRYFGKIPTVVLLDTHWNGSVKQYLATFLSRMSLLKIFSNAWVPGSPQFEYARKLGFKEASIKTGFYCCDLDRFNNIYQRQRALKSECFPRRFLYAGRYYEFKGITDLWDAFIELQAEIPNEWELWCMGTGSLNPVEHPKIKHLGFVQPGNVETVTGQCGVFILPSRFEPWAVVVQEYAAAGFPLILSGEVGASEAFLVENDNGFSFKAGNKTELKNQLKKMIHLKDVDLKRMAGNSHQLAQKINPGAWVQTLTEIYYEFNKK
jgi:glycosyltransferase involved in cell wall biosynthesis